MALFPFLMQESGRRQRSWQRGSRMQ